MNRRCQPDRLGRLLMRAALTGLAFGAVACGEGAPNRERIEARDTAAAADTAPAADTAAAGDTAAASAQLDFLDIHYRAIGTEPFWSVEMTGEGMVYHRAGEDPVRFPFGQLRRRAGADEMTSSADGRTLRVTITEEPCRDGMSPRRYDYAARVVIDAVELHGCAIADPPPVEAPADSD